MILTSININTIYTDKSKMFISLNIINIILTKIIIVIILLINIKTFFQEYIRPNAYPKNKIYIL